MLVYVVMTVTTVREAIKYMREKSQESQQVFATRLGIAMRTLQHHESGKPAEVSVLGIYLGEAYRIGNIGLIALFVEAIHEQLPEIPGYAWNLTLAPKKKGTK
jgi:DNA-binding XRE family transcriptional regulator